MLEPVNKIYYKKSDFDSIDEMFSEVYRQQLALVKNKYMCLLYRSPSDRDIFVLEFASLDPTFNQRRLLPCWITPQEAAMIAKDRLSAYDSESVTEVVKDSLKLDDEDEDIDDELDDFTDEVKKSDA